MNVTTRFQYNFKTALRIFAKNRGKTAGVAKEELSAIIGKTTQSIYGYARGQVVPPLASVEKIANAFGLHAREFFRTPEDFRRIIIEQFSEKPSVEQDVSELVSANIRLLMNKKDCSQSLLSQKTKLSKALIHSILSGKQTPSLEALETICKALSVEPYELLTPTEETTQIAKYDALRIDGAPPVRVFDHCVQFSVQCTLENANRLLQLAEAQHTSPNEVIRHLLEEKED